MAFNLSQIIKKLAEFAESKDFVFLLRDIKALRKDVLLTRQAVEQQNLILMGIFIMLSLYTLIFFLSVFYGR